MTTYIKYQCSLCRRNKDIERDPLRVAPSKCTITKGCAGTLIAYDQTAVPESTLPLAGVEDWYPRGMKKTVSMKEKPVEYFEVSSSTTGSLTIAAQYDNESDVPEFLEMILLQRRNENVAVQDHTYRVVNPQSVFSGRDSNGKILRFDSQAIAESRIQVRVNGVLSTTAVLTPNTVTFPTPITTGSIVSVRVQLEKDTVERTIKLMRNKNVAPTASRGSWANVDYVSRFDGAQFKKWWLFSIDQLASLIVGKISVVSYGTVNPGMILLAHSPYESFDRYIEFIVPMERLIGQFHLSLETSKGARLLADKVSLNELYPTLRLDSESFISPDGVKTSASSQIMADGGAEFLKSSKILGPK
jgi:hypothetical protein